MPSSPCRGIGRCPPSLLRHSPVAGRAAKLILCVRNLCDDEGSALMAEQLEAALKGKLYAPGERPQKLPSPEALRNLVLLYCDPKLDASGAAAVPAALNRVIAITQLNLPTLGAWAAAPHAGCADLTESVSPELGNKREMLAFTSANVARVLPNQGRVDANTNGSSAWYNGCQLYGINAHVPDLGRWLSDTKFSANGGCGYVRRPGWQSGEGLAPDRMDSSQKKYLKVQALHAKAAKKGQLGITMLLSGVGASDTLKTTQRYADTKDAKLKESAWIIPIAAVNLGMALFVLKDYSQPSAEADGGTTLGYTGITIGSLVVGTFKFPLVKPDGGATKHVLTISLGWQ